MIPNMSTLPGRLGTLTARDVMTRAVIVLTEDESVEDAVARLKEHHITGAPVVDGTGKLVGILSLSDLVTPPGDAPSSQLVPLAHEDVTAWDLFDRGGPLDRQMGVERVSQRMSRHVASVSEESSLVEAARVMCSGHWHRVPVVDGAGSLCGIISSMDVLAALVNVADEAA
jgi:CBS-domain-containing membrane protein